MDTLKEIEKIVKKIGLELKQVDINKLELEEKDGVGNIVTNYDKYVQKYLKEKLLKLFPEAGFIGEENDEKIDDFKEYVFIVDPIDGTMNFARNLSSSMISVALLKNKENYISVCYNPYLDEMYTAKKNEGAYLNGKKIHVSNKTLKNGLFLCGSAPYYEELRKKSLEIQKKLFEVSSDFRRFGSAVVELCNIASGKAEVYFELKLQPWDFAAGMLIVEEAGGQVTDIDGNKLNPFKSSSLLATNKKENYIEYMR